MGQPSARPVPYHMAMDRKRVILSIVVVATVGVATALTYPALAGTDPDPGPRVSSKMLATLQRDLGLTRAQAEARVKKEAWAIQTREALSQELGTTYGGAWLNADASQLTVAVTNPDRAAAVRAAGAEPKLVARSARQLDAIKQNLDRQASRATASIAGWYADPATNSVVVVSTAASAGRAFIASSGVTADAVRVVTTNQRPKLLAAPAPAAGSLPVRGGDPYFIDNVARCSVGFPVEGGFISAGHCGQVGSTTTGAAGDEQVPQGTFEASTFPESDFSFVATNADWTPVGEVNSFQAADGNLPLAGSEEAPVGTSVCKFGSTTGASCGVIQALDVTVNFVDPEDGIGTVTVNGLIQTDVCAEPGDSGGSLLAGDQAQGTVSGGSGDCTAGGQTFFQPINEVLQALDLTLLTTS
jgi:streptogrisin C